MVPAHSAHQKRRSEVHRGCEARRQLIKSAQRNPGHGLAQVSPLTVMEGGSLTNGGPVDKSILYKYSSHVEMGGLVFDL